ncbi:TANC2 [Symbiodinium natans]|uniref:TANC2 protein n=1 Tax=Symbiodinium natans TaxID=878477 RepID=A0A812Q9A5_9DINO|nr:TANC2 [Symbiodinium natans]
MTRPVERGPSSPKPLNPLTPLNFPKARTCALCRTPVLSVAHCPLLEQLIAALPLNSMYAHVISPCSHQELKQALRDLGKGDLNNIPAGYRTDAVKGAAYRAIRKSDLPMLTTCIRDFKVRASTKLLCEAAVDWSGDPAVVGTLMAHGARVNGHQDERPLAAAAQKGNLLMLRALLEAGADPMKPIGEEGETALHYAVRFGRFESVRALLDHGVPADLPDQQGRTPLSLAEKGLVMHVQTCGMQPCSRCEARIQIRGELRWRLGKSGAASAPPPPAPAQPDPASEDSSTDVEEYDGTEASDVCENEYDEEGEEEVIDVDDEDDSHEL